MGIWDTIKNLFKKESDEIESSEIPEEPPIILKIVDKCNVCSKKINTLTGWRCAYCDEWHCDRHRLPEEHDCKGKPMSPPKTKGKPIDLSPL